MKRKTLLISLVCCLVLQTNAQTLNNTIVNDNSSWATLIYELGSYGICNVSTQYVYFESDSIVAGDLYKKVFSCEDKLHENIKFEGLIREEGKKTYFIPANSETEYLLYDFSLEEGMSFEYSFLNGEPSATFYVNRVDSIETNGTMKKRMELKLSGRDVDTWIEEIGSLSGILHPMYKGFLGGNERLLLCYYQSDELVYKSSVYPECYYDDHNNIVSVQTIMIDNNVDVYPNPIDDALTVFSSKNTISQIDFFDISGKIFYSQTYKGTIDVSSFSKGLYLLKVYDTNKQVSVFKILKK